LQGQGNDLGIVLGLAALILILLRLEPSFEIDQAALLEVFLADLSKPAPGFDVDPFGVFLALK
jgi:hypothetical protein